MPEDPDLTPRPVPARRTPDPELLARGRDAASDVILSLLSHVSELDSVDLPTVDGRAVRIVSLSEVEEWLTGCATRARAGTL